MDTPKELTEVLDILGADRLTALRVAAIPYKFPEDVKTWGQNIEALGFTEDAAAALELILLKYFHKASYSRSLATIVC